MGSWRKVGAFLGLVPDGSHQYDEDGYEGAGYETGQYDDGYDGQRERNHSAAAYARESAGSKAYPKNGYTDRADDPYARDSYRAQDQGQSESATAGSPGSQRRAFRSEPVTQGALAVKAEQRREAENMAASRPASVKLTGFSEARVVGEKYRDGQSVILDMTGMSDADARRLVDFSAGLAFSLRGSIEKVAPKVFMLLPAEADIAGGSATALEDARAYVGGYAAR